MAYYTVLLYQKICTESFRSTFAEFIINKIAQRNLETGRVAATGDRSTHSRRQMQAVEHSIIVGVK